MYANIVVLKKPDLNKKDYPKVRIAQLQYYINVTVKLNSAATKKDPFIKVVYEYETKSSYFNK